MFGVNAKFNIKMNPTYPRGIKHVLYIHAEQKSKQIVFQQTDQTINSNNQNSDYWKLFTFFVLVEP